MGNALVFPGQGSQAPGMGKKVFETFAPSRGFLLEANDILGFNLEELIFGNDAEALKPTEIAQPAIYTVSAMYLELFRSHAIPFDYVAGHSLGEYSALYAAGVFSFAEGLSLVRKRGQLMSVSTEKTGGMAAIIGLPLERIEEICTNYSEVWLANINTQNQFVISGSLEQVRSAMSLSKEFGAKIAIELNVSTAFHTPFMNKAEEELGKEINRLTFMAPSVPVFSNYTGLPSRDIVKIKENLIHQLTGQVRWAQTMQKMDSSGVENVYEIGYGTVLKGMLKTFPNLKPVSVL
jgi:[acyl-carrier-protein] S-malonyltransferase